MPRYGCTRRCIARAEHAGRCGSGLKTAGKKPGPWAGLSISVHAMAFDDMGPLGWVAVSVRVARRSTDSEAIANLRECQISGEVVEHSPFVKRYEPTNQFRNAESDSGQRR